MIHILAGAQSEEESRAYLQTRLTVFWKIMFWVFSTLMASQWVMYEVVYPSSRPHYQGVVYIIGSSAVALIALVWRGLLVRRTLTVGQLFGLDLFIGCGCGACLGAVAVITHDFPPAHYVCLIYGSFVVFTRAIVVPSSGRWTALISVVALLPLTAAAAILVVYFDTGSGGSPGILAVPKPMFFGFAALLCGVAALLAATGSRIIYGLRRQVTAAKQVGQYRLDRKIGEGSMGVVWRAHHIMLRRPTAVKLLQPDRVGVENLERFEREVHHTSQLTHPNTVAVYDYGRTPDGVFYYAMEYLGGGIDLENLVRKFGPQPAGRVAHILAQVCGALYEAHQANLIHRDIKPANIILCERGGMPDVAKVVDFGLVKEITTESSTSAQVILGTPAYIAPEAVTDPNAIGAAVDLYALGAVGYYLLTGRRVFEGNTVVDVCIQHVTATPRPPSEHVPVPAELDAIIMRCLEKQPGNRFADAREMAGALHALTSEWDDTEASRWWREFRVAEVDSDLACALPTLTVTVDLDVRIA